MHRRLILARAVFFIRMQTAGITSEMRLLPNPRFCDTKFSMERQTSPRLLLLLAILAFAVRIVSCWASGSLGRSPDMYREYVHSGSRLVSHGVITCPLIHEDVRLEPSNMLPPAYTVVVAGVYSLLGVETTASTLTLQFLNAVATSVAVLLVFGIARRLCDSRAGWLAAIWVALNPVVFGQTRLLWDTSIFIFSVCLVLWVLLRLADRPYGWKRQIGFGVLLGVVAHVNPALTIAYPFLVLWMLMRKGNRSAAMIVRGTALTTMGWLVAITPWTMRNYHHFGELSYIRSSLGLVLWLGACPEAHANPAEVYAAWYPMQNEQQQRILLETGEQAFFQEWGRMARTAIRNDFGGWLKLCGLRAVDYWTGSIFSHAIPGNGGWPTNALRACITVLISLETLSMIIGLLYLRHFGAHLWWLVATILVFSIVYTLTHVQLRYRAPMEPMIAIVLAVVSVRIFDRRLRQTSP